MNKQGHDIPSPGELYEELRLAVNHLGAVAAALNITPPNGMTELLDLSEPEIIDLWTSSRASLTMLDEAWNDEAAKFVNQRLSVSSVMPAGSEPNS